MISNNAFSRGMSSISPASDSFAFDQSEVRLLASVKYWALKAASAQSILPNRQSLRNIFRDSSDIVDEVRYRKLKADWCEKWRKTTCDLLDLGELINEEKLHEALKGANLSTTKRAAN